MVKAADLLLIGPQLKALKVATCRSGEICSVQLAWGNVAPVSGVLSVDTKDSHCRFEAGMVVEGFGGVATGTTSFQWPNPLKTLGGRYSLCWCASPCTGTDWTVEIAELEVQGPFTNQNFSCLEQRQCHVAPLAGLHLVDGDQLLISDAACGEAAPSIALTSMTSENCGKFVGGCTFIWSAYAVALAQLGTFNLCWCRSGNCTSPNDFHIHVGILTIIKDSGYQ